MKSGIGFQPDDGIGGPFHELVGAVDFKVGDTALLWVQRKTHGVCQHLVKPRCGLVQLNFENTF